MAIKLPPPTWSGIPAEPEGYRTVLEGTRALPWLVAPGSTDAEAALMIADCVWELTMEAVVPTKLEKYVSVGDLLWDPGGGAGG